MPPARVTEVTANARHELALAFSDGRRFILDMSYDVATMPSLYPLRDKTAFVNVIIDNRGYSISWPEHDIQIGSDILLAESLVYGTPLL